MIDPILYAQVFDGTPAGQQVLAELVDLFGAVQWIKGGPEADRETARMLGRHEVVNHILQQMTKATT
ncbi:MAG: hypothetical protein ACK51Q_08440 [Betaproteobacteria bacterium]